MRIRMGAWRRACAAAIVAAAVSTSIAATATAAPLNDDFDDRLTLQLDDSDTRSNADGSIEAGEPLTANDPAGLGCEQDGDVTPSGRKSSGTVWWQFTGNGGPVTVSTLASTFDTILVVYELDGGVLGDRIGCNDDIQPHDSTRPNLAFRAASELMLASTGAGQQYAVQVGGCCASPSGDVTVRVSKPPPNDDRAAATQIPAGGTATAANFGATVEPGELTSCEANPYDKTVWFRYTAPARGTAVFSASGFDTVLTVYRGAATAPIGCNDDAVAGDPGPSRLPSSQPAGGPVEVLPGDYLIQIGGYYDLGFSTIAARNGLLQVQVQFSADLDHDDDGIDAGNDCDDENPAIRPGARERLNDSVDENCDGIAAFDRDGDGVLAPPAGLDCQDTNGLIYPGATEIRGNRTDEDCDGEAEPPRTLDVSITFEYSQAGRVAVIEKISVVPNRRARVEIRCRGKRCAFRRAATVLRPRAASLLDIPVLRGELGLGRGESLRVPPGVQVAVRVTKPGHVGKLRVFTVGRRVRLSPYRCVGPKGNRRPCPGSG